MVGLVALVRGSRLERRRRLASNEVRLGGQRNNDRAVNDREVADHVPGRAERYLNWTDAGFTSIDHNRDSRITANEWHFDLESFRRADRNQDDVLTRAEFVGGDGEDDGDGRRQRPHVALEN